MSRQYLDFPFRVDGRGHTATVPSDEHIRDLIYQVLFTGPGERINRPDFGCGIRQLVFMPSGDALATATRFIVQGALQRWLADVIEVDHVGVSAEGERLSVEVIYTRKDNGERRRDAFAAPASTGGLP
jgi:uncharacterized protein